MAKPYRVGLSLMLEPDFIQASFPLFEAGVVDILEWSFDTLWNPLPEWAEELLNVYAKQHCLLGHGVTYSPLSAHFSLRQQQWLKKLGEECQRRSYEMISEHFGFMAAGPFLQGSPLPVPYHPEFLKWGQDHLKRLADTAQLPIGLENLAFAFGESDVRKQGCFLEELLEPVQGFLVLDLHNLYCQQHNFSQDPVELLESYPLHRVRELHLSGGSWYQSHYRSEGNLIRRDTHDGEIPKAVWDLLKIAVPRCQKLEFIIIERLGNTFKTLLEMKQFQNDFYQLRELLNHV